MSPLRSRLHPLPPALLAAGLVAVLGTGTAVAATGSPLVLGRLNSADHTTTLATTAGVPLALAGPDDTTPPLRVDSSARVRNLNADRVDGKDAATLEREARTDLLPAWQVVVAPDGSIAAGSTRVASARRGAGDYSLTWTGFPGRAVPHCTGISRPAVVVSTSADADGTGTARVSSSGTDTRFACLLVAVPAAG
jgi:hypothetical protein